MVGVSLLSCTLPVMESGDSPIIGVVRLFTVVLVQTYVDGVATILWRLALFPAAD